MKITYCLNTVSNRSGREIIVITKANALAELDGYDVYIIVLSDNGKSVIPLSPKVHLVNLNLYSHAFYSQSSGIKTAIKTIFYRYRFKDKLSKTLREIQPDIVISTGSDEKFILPSLKGKWKTIREMHMAKNYRPQLFRTPISKLLGWCEDLYEYHWEINKYDRIVLLTDEDRENNWPKTSRTEVIPNPLTFESESSSALDAKKIIAIGRLAYQKNFGSLISAFKTVVTKHLDWTLEIYGEGPQENELRQQIEQSGLSKNVFLCGYDSNIRDKMLDASCFVLSSRFEGFGLVLIEALSCGLPVISYACPCGPKDIISDGEDGFLIALNDEEALAECICRLIENDDLRKQMGHAAKVNSERYKIGNIMPMWVKLFERLVKC